MDLSNNKIDFSNLLSSIEANRLLERFTQLSSHIKRTSTDSIFSDKNEHLEEWKSQWQKLPANDPDNINGNVKPLESAEDSEQIATDWLIRLFNVLFADQQVVLVRSKGEPEYFPAQNNGPARIEFAHGFFASALHELHTPLYRLTC
jgi:hypothetical protein